MFKKLLSMVVVCIGMMGLLGTKANGYPPSLGGWGVWRGSATVLTEWVGIANTDLKPTIADVDLRIRGFMIDAVLNPGGEDGGVGQPFIQVPTEPFVVNNAAGIFDVPLKGRGGYDLPILFSDEKLTQAIVEVCQGTPVPSWCNDGSLPKLPNINWYWHVIVLDADVRIKGYTDYDKDGSREEVVFAVGYCVLPGYDPSSPQTFKPSTINYEDPYGCTENFHWEYANKDKICYETPGNSTTPECDDITNWWKFNLP